MHGDMVEESEVELVITVEASLTRNVAGASVRAAVTVTTADTWPSSAFSAARFWMHSKESRHPGCWQSPVKTLAHKYATKRLKSIQPPKERPNAAIESHCTNIGLAINFYSIFFHFIYGKENMLVAWYFAPSRTQNCFDFSNADV